MEILAFIAKNWVEWLFALCLAVLTWGYRTMTKKIRDEHDKNEAIAEGVQSLLRESLVSNYNTYKDKGYCPIYAKESIKKVYHAYHGLNGNDVATGLYQELLAMPTEKPEGGRDETA